jgi:hypothetical protein
MLASAAPDDPNRPDTRARSTEPPTRSSWSGARIGRHEAADSRPYLVRNAQRELNAQLTLVAGLIRPVRTHLEERRDAVTAAGDKTAVLAGTPRRNAGIQARVPPESL